MADIFSICLASVLKYEGGYVNNPHDRGGATNKGITQAVYDNYLASNGQSAKSVKDITDADVADIYRTQYWNPIHGDDLPLAVASVLFDSAVNSGVKQATKWLQRAVSVKDDGSLGPLTLKATKALCVSLGDKVVAKKILDHRTNFIHDIIERNVSQAVFEKGWLNRIASLNKVVDSMVA